MFGLNKKEKAEEVILAETETEAVVKERIGGCGHIFQERCQLRGILADDECRCSQWK